MTEVKEAVLKYIRKHALLKPGDRLGVAVSGGADSVSLLLALAELRSELGIIISAVHLNHKIRGTEADADESFVAELANKLELPFHHSCGDAPAHAAAEKISLETAARDLRYAFFRKMIADNTLDKIATAHTMDDQAETVLLRLLRGAGTRGLGGIHPELDENIIRPLLEGCRTEVEAFLKSRNQPWCNDSTNSDVVHARNKIRHELLPLLARDYNPAIVETLARTAEVTRDEEHFWTAETARLLPFVLLPGKPVRGGGRSSAGKVDASGLSIEALLKQPLALQRRLIRAAAESLGIALDIHHVADILALVAGGKKCELPGGWRVERSFRELRFERAKKSAQGQAFELPFPVPGETAVPGGNLVVYAHLLPANQQLGRYNHPTLAEKTSAHSPQRTPILFSGEDGKMEPLGAADSLTLRNWRAGDRFKQAQSGSEKKVKELLEDLQIPSGDRQNWPVLALGNKLIWVYATRSNKLWLEENGKLQQLIIETSPHAQS
ncbi:MAG: tRNA(Ile)-lysidine synthetase-like protein [Acidobacteriales bacterium]|nr:tRNA(Ile)-lysidine synthetase-like protein [Terriglobales bacterium]